MTAVHHRAPLPALLALALACAPRTAPESPLPVPTGAESAAPALPTIPLREGPLEIRVVYPPAEALIGSRDSNFIFGSVGNGRASLTIDGHPVEVHPNGAFIAFIPVPPIEEPWYELVAAVATDSVRATHPVRVRKPRPVLADTGALVVDTASLAPAAGLLLPGGEPVRVAVEAPTNAALWVQERGGGRRALVPRATSAASLLPSPERLASAEIGQPDTISAPATVPATGRDGVYWSTDVPARVLADSAILVAARGADTIRLPLAHVDTVPPGGWWGMLGAAPSSMSDTDRVIHGRPVAGGTYRWAFLAGTPVRVTGATAGFARVRLGEGLDVWVSRDDVRLFPDGYAAPRPVAGNMRVVPSAEWSDVIIPMGERAPHLVELDGDRMILTLYGARANTDIIRWVGNDSLIRNITWVQEAGGRARYTLHLREPPFGWLAFWDGSSFVLRVRRPPRVDARRPLAGLTIAVDAGHPPAGATGPMGLYEAVPVLAIARRLRSILEERGAAVLMTRDAPEPVALAERPVIARRGNAHALVSIHLNALPDGVNPFTAHGTGAYFFHPPSEPLAREIQRGMVEWMGLRNLGVYYDNLALVRPTWMPSVLCEGAFLMMPEQEHAVTTEEFQERYARGVADGLERYFGALAGR